MVWAVLGLPCTFLIMGANCESPTQMRCDALISTPGDAHRDDGALTIDVPGAEDVTVEFPMSWFEPGRETTTVTLEVSHFEITAAWPDGATTATFSDTTPRAFTVTCHDEVDDARVTVSVSGGREPCTTTVNIRCRRAGDPTECLGDGLYLGFVDTEPAPGSGATSDNDHEVEIEIVGDTVTVHRGPDGEGDTGSGMRGEGCAINATNDPAGRTWEYNLVCDHRGMCNGTGRAPKSDDTTLDLIMETLFRPLGRPGPWRNGPACGTFGPPDRFNGSPFGAGAIDSTHWFSVTADALQVRQTSDDAIVATLPLAGLGEEPTVLAQSGTRYLIGPPPGDNVGGSVALVSIESFDSPELLFTFLPPFAGATSEGVFAVDTESLFLAFSNMEMTVVEQHLLADPEPVVATQTAIGDAQQIIDVGDAVWLAVEVPGRLLSSTGRWLRMDTDLTVIDSWEVADDAGLLRGHFVPSDGPGDGTFYAGATRGLVAFDLSADGVRPRFAALPDGLPRVRGVGAGPDYLFAYGGRPDTAYFCMFAEPTTGIECTANITDSAGPAPLQAIGLADSIHAVRGGSGAIRADISGCI